MSEVIRFIGMKMSHKGICNKCGLPRIGASHKKCDRWPGSKGFHYVSNSKQSSLADLKRIVTAICAGDEDDTPVRFDIRIMQTAAAPEKDGAQ